MKQDWVLDVLTDLKSFAQQNGMFNLAEHLDDSLLVAAAELTVHTERKRRGEPGENDRITDQHIAAGKQSK